jgi:hypothetical protein
MVRVFLSLPFHLKTSIFMADNGERPGYSHLVFSIATVFSSDYTSVRICLKCTTIPVLELTSC